MRYLTPTTLILILLATACAPQAGATPEQTQPPQGVIATPPHATPTEAAASPLLRWEGEDCTVLETDGESLAYGPCDGELTGAPASELDLLRLERWQSLYAPFEASIAGSSIMEIGFKGEGAVNAIESEQRAIAEWASLRYDELEAGRTSAAWGLVLDWNREGGIAGFCDEVTIYLTGDYYVSSCKTPSPTAGPTPTPELPSQLTAAQLEQLYAFYDTLAGFDYQYTDPAVADAMTIRFTFAGQGEVSATDEDVQAINSFASGLVVQSAQEPQPPAAVAAQNALADSLGITADEVTIVGVTPVDWPDSCLGVHSPGVMCAQVVTPGYVVVLEASGTEYTFHTNQNGTSIVAAP
jgi:predicted outer membrane protein